MAFNGKVALVTGGASGMGRASALRLAGLGAKVAIVDLNEAALAATAAESGNITPYRCDVSDLQQVREVVARIEQELGPVDRLTHCAAIMPGDSIRSMSAELTNKQMLINYCGTVNMVKTLMPLMEQRGGGQIIMFGSMAGSVLTYNLGSYSATKAAVNTFAEVLVRENPDSPVQFLLVCPPMVDTPLIEQAVEKGPAGIKESREKKRMRSPEYIVDAVEKALDRRQWIVQPGEAKFLMWLRRYFPGVLWKIMEGQK
jgi:NAD(P)-dependent dehydrogenase (short-subunit alcohol dehydrogenase family)